MRPNVYQALVQALNKDGAGAEHLLSMLTTQDENRIALTIKNYKQPTGLSEKFFERFT
jgi:NAD(P)H-flavin reductase